MHDEKVLCFSLLRLDVNDSVGVECSDGGIMLEFLGIRINIEVDDEWEQLILELNGHNQRTKRGGRRGFKFLETQDLSL